MKIVILAPGGGYDASALPMIPTDSQVSVLGFESSPEVVGTVVPLQRPGGWRAKLTAAAARTMLGRVLLRLTRLIPGWSTGALRRPLTWLARPSVTLTCLWPPNGMPPTQPGGGIAHMRRSVVRWDPFSATRPRGQRSSEHPHDPSAPALHGLELPA